MLTKIVNGIEVQMSADEEVAIRAEWDANDPAKQIAEPLKPTLDDVLSVLYQDAAMKSRLDDVVSLKTLSANTKEK